jgi:hypothetical protein
MPTSREPIVMQSEWLRCLDCGWEWDDMGGGYICDCFDRLGRRRSERIITWPTVNGSTNTPPSMTLTFMADAD